MAPAVGAYKPAIRLKVVLLPEPLGPIKPRISPSARSNEIEETAVKPPNFLVRLLTLSMREVSAWRAVSLHVYPHVYLVVA